MAVTDGLETGDAAAQAARDPFQAALVEKGVLGAAEGGSSLGTSVADGLTFGPQPGTPEAPAATVTEPQGATTETAPEAPEVDPEIAAYLERFGGDTVKALAAAVEAQKMIGRQGNELGTTQQQLAKLQGQVEALTQIAQQGPPAPVIQLDPETIDDGILQYGGLQFATRVANEAPAQLDAVLARWAEDEPYNAAVFRQEYIEWQRQQEAAKVVTPEPGAAEVYVQQQLEAQRMETVLAATAADPAFAATFESFKEYLMPALEQAEPFVQAGVASDDPTIQQQAVRIVFRDAQILAAKELGTKAEAAQATKTAASKLAATVISGGFVDPAAPAPAAGTDSQAADREQQIATFKSMILSAPSTSVKDGLTYGKA